MEEPIISRVISSNNACVVTALDLCHKREHVKTLIRVMKEKMNPSNMKCDLSGDECCAIQDCLCDFLQFIDADLRRR